MYEQIFQVSGLCGPQFLSYLPKRLFGDAILVYSFGAPIWPPEKDKNIWTFFLYTSSFFSLEN